MKIVVAGGGYAGLACLMELRRRMCDAELHLYDPRSHHLKITHLHETVRVPRARFEVPFSEIAARLKFEHHRDAIGIDAGQPVCGDGELDYDYLVITTGAKPPALPRAEHCYDRDDLCRLECRDIVDAFVADRERPRTVTVVGGGATGIQFLFELAGRLRERRNGAGLRLVDREPHPVAGQPSAIGHYVREKLEADRIDYLPATDYVSASADAIVVRDADGERTLPSGLTFLFPGARPAPQSFMADRFGRVESIRDCFAAGDCAAYDSRGDDQMTAQVAVRQGKHIACNIDRLSRGVAPLEYFFRELGYVVSLGVLDAAGWMLTQGQVVTGVPAAALKGAIEAQYDLFVAGIDTYVV